MPHLDVLPPGTMVCIGEKVQATVIGIEIRAHNYVRYELVWWQNDERRVAWADRVEIKSTGEVKDLRVGFAPPVGNGMPV